MKLCSAWTYYAPCRYARLALGGEKCLTMRSMLADPQANQAYCERSFQRDAAASGTFCPRSSSIGSS